MHYDDGRKHKYSADSASKLMRKTLDGETAFERPAGVRDVRRSVVGVVGKRRPTIGEACPDHHGEGLKIQRHGKTIEDYRKMARDSRTWLLDRFMCAVACWVDLFFLQLTTLALKAVYCVKDPVEVSRPVASGQCQTSCRKWACMLADAVQDSYVS